MAETNYYDLFLDTSIPYLHLSAIEGIEQMNEHGELTISFVLPPEEDVNQLIEKNYQSEVMTLRTRNEILFKGVLQELTFSYDGEVKQGKLHLSSCTKKLDLKKRNRSFQDPQQTGESILNEVLYQQGDYRAISEINQPSNAFFLQYEETDWKFINKLAAFYASFIVADVKGEIGRFWVGMKTGRNISEKLINQSEETDFKNLHQMNQNYQLLYSRFMSKQVVSIENYELGDYLVQENQRYVIIKKNYHLQQSRLHFIYELVKEEFLLKRPSLPFVQEKVSLEGTVVAVLGNRAKVHLDIDQNKGNAQLSWLENSVEGSNIAYFMPEIGSKVSVAFSHQADVFPHIALGIRQKTESYQKQMSDPETKIFQNPQEKQLVLSRNTAEILADGVSITLTDHQAIQISSQGDIGFSGASAVNIASNSKVSINGRNSLITRSSLCSIKLATRVDIYGSSIQYTSNSIGKAVHNNFEGKQKDSSKKRELTPVQAIDRLNAGGKLLNSLPIAAPAALQSVLARIPRTNEPIPFKRVGEDSKEKLPEPPQETGAAFRAVLKRQNQPERSDVIQKQLITIKNGAFQKEPLDHLIEGETDERS